MVKLKETPKVKKKKSLPTSSSKSRIHFESFSRQLSDLRLPKVSLLGRHDLDGDLDLGSSSVRDAVLKWQELNLSQSFSELSSSLHPLTANISAVVNNRTKIFDRLLAASDSEISTQSVLALEPILDLWHGLALDLQSDFMEFYPDFARVSVAALHAENISVVRTAFESVCGVAKILQRRVDPPGKSLAETLLDGLEKHRETEGKVRKEQVEKLVAQVLSQIYRRSKEKRTIQEWLMAEEKKVKMAVGMLVSAVTVPSKDERTWKEAVGMMTTILENRKEDWQKSMQILSEAEWKERKWLLDDLGRVVAESENVITMETKLYVLQEILKSIGLKNVEFGILQWTESAFKNLSAKSLPDPSRIQEYLSTLMSGLEHSLVMKKPMTDIVNAWIDASPIDAATKFNLLTEIPPSWSSNPRECRLYKFFQECDDDLETLVAFANVVGYICADKDWQTEAIYVSHEKNQTEVSDKLLSKLEIIANEDLDQQDHLSMEEMLKGILFLRPFDVSRLKKCLKIVLEKHANTENLNLLLVSVKALNKCCPNEATKLLPKNFLKTLSQFLSTNVATEIISIISLSDISYAEKNINKADLVKALSTQNRTCRLHILTVLSALMPNTILETLSRAEKIEPGLQTFRERIRQFQNVNLEEENDLLTQEAAIRMLLSNYFEDFAPLWSPVTDMIVEKQPSFSDGSFWNVMEDFFEKLGVSLSLTMMTTCFNE